MAEIAAPAGASRAADDLAGQVRRMLECIESMRAENSELVSRCQELIRENNNLFKLYVASHHMHASLITAEVLRIISEIVVDLVGVKGFAIYMNDDRTQTLFPVRHAGLDDIKPPRVKVGEGSVGSIVSGDGGYFAQEPPADGSFSLDRPLVVIPLRVEGKILGAIAIYRLLSHKAAFTEVDYAMFDFFAAHAATALQSARLYAEAEGKVKKMKEFLTLMKEQEQPS